MATIANLVAKADGSFEGTLATLSVTAPIAILPNGRKVKDSEPDYRVISKKNGLRTRRRLGPHVADDRCRICLGIALGPELGTMYCNIANAPGDDASQKVLIWNPPS